MTLKLIKTVKFWNYLNWIWINITKTNDYFFESVRKKNTSVHTCLDVKNFYKHTYIHKWSLHPFSRNYSLASNTTHVVCVNFIRKQ